NYSDISYDGDGSSEDGKRSSTPTIKILVIQGAGCFLKSHSDFQLFLNKIELAELNGADFIELQDILNAAINSMECANTTYFNLKNLAADTPYNQEVIEQLRTFDYDGFLEGKGLNAAVFSRVKGFLIKRDVTGAYESMFLDTVDLLDRLNQIKQDIDNNKIPDISKLWELNQEYSDTLFFGQYTAAIFFEIHGIIKYKY
ncbi:MAG: hypothetical protein GTO45_04210, partial [Candidatus Aminicenantes bacterium]|nr:hypothetical protein [Candidatus Aminicenantes bacterium]NIM82274.1 hypothetical protein [Candidatus Aminicenantes bacterium]NIN17272.1 hypothetical protein [Candidatus Aminicenantes bacterium]NIN41141.1 hypothetical protein [Candidatus Aminicenantes bacterium]NIN83940.1 hypothetical protein [Candidatus Aminicenantes bacterium]